MGLFSKKDEIINDALKELELMNMNESKSYNTTYLPLHQIVDNSENRFNVEDTAFLEDSIDRLVQLQPLIVVQLKDEHDRLDDKYEIKAGSRRFKVLNSLYKKAIMLDDETNKERFSKAFVLILPNGATEEEIQSVITETNTTTRQVTVSEVFRNFEIIFKSDDDGNLINLPKNVNKYNYISNILNEAGFTFSPASVKDYISIYFAHNKDIRENFEKGYLKKRHALIISRMTNDMQDRVMEDFKVMSTEDFETYIKQYGKKKRNKALDDNIRGIDAINKLDKISKEIDILQNKINIDFKDVTERQQFIDRLSLITLESIDLRKKVENKR